MLFPSRVSSSRLNLKACSSSYSPSFPVATDWRSALIVSPCHVISTSLFVVYFFIALHLIA